MQKSMFWIFVLLLLAGENCAFNNVGKQGSDSWTGRWFPSTPIYRSDIEKGDDGRIPMGVLNPRCDDGKTNITLDLSMRNGVTHFEEFTCTNPRSRYVPDKKIKGLIEFENIPKAYLAPHFCMDRMIKYNRPLPTFGAHRPLWPVYGEYKFLPIQRWLHSLEHGGIVAVYHPCADPTEIKLLKELVKGCLRRYVITPSGQLTKERPLGLLAWGVRFTMSTVSPTAVRRFIRERALKGHEKVPGDGQFNISLIEKSSIVSDYRDSHLCPNQQ